jgi:hypothetical protein
MACSKEDTPEVSFKNPTNKFIPAADDQSEEAQLRRQFFTETGSYLLFNDTLQHDSMGVDINGNTRYSTETLDLFYNVGSSGTITSKYTLTYLDTQEEKTTVANFLKDYIMPHLTGELRPYSWMAARTITVINNLGKKLTPYALPNQRCIAIQSNYLLIKERNNDEKQYHARMILNTIGSQLATNHSEAFTEFYKFNAQYYGQSYDSMGYQSLTTAQLNEIGFLSASSTFGSFPTMGQDLTSFSSAVVAYTDEQLEQRYGKYQIVMQKLAVVKDVMTKLGYVF